MKKIQTISIMTATGQYNIGDELILEQEYRILKEKFKTAKFTIFTYDKNSSILEDELNYVTYFPYNIKKNPFKNIGYLIKNIFVIAQSDLVVIGGGGLIYDNEKTASDPINQWKLRVFFAKLFKKKILFFGLGINVSENKYEKLKYLFDGKNTQISVRDKKSQEILNKIGIKSKIIDDPVFSKEPIKKEVQQTKIVGMSFRSGFLPNEKENIEKIIQLIQTEGHKIIFVTHSFHGENIEVNDYLFLEDLAKKYEIEITSTQNETLEMYKYLDYMIGMRLHSVILSIVNSIPYICLSYARKTEEVNSEIGYTNVIDCKEFNFDNFEKMWHNLEVNQKGISQELQKQYDNIRLRTKFNLNNFLNGLE